MTRRTRYTGREMELPTRPTPPPVPPPPAADVPVQLYTLEQAAQRLAVCERTLRNRIRAGKIRAVKIGTGVRVSEAELRRVATEGA